MLIYRKIARKIPALGLKLRQARMPDSPEYYVKKTFFTAFYVALGVLIIGFLFTKSGFVFLAFPIIFVVAFFYFLHYVDVKINRIRNEINKEIIFAGRFLIIELESGVPLYQAFINLAKNYEVIGSYAAEIVEKVDLGTTMEEALADAVEVTPSENLRKLLWQVLNSLKTGSNVTASLDSVIDQIVRQLQIDVKEYGRKLSPLAMFYMMIAVIAPSLGITMTVVLATFIGFTLTMPLLLTVVGVMGFIQFLFLGVIRSQRPPMDI
jgi:pilus assembly protein TadC